MDIIEQTDPPAAMSRADYARWRRRLSALVARIKQTARRVLRRADGTPMLAPLGRLRGGVDDPISQALIEFVYEFGACHVAGPAGRTVAECAVDAAGRLPGPMRPYLPALAESVWDLFEIMGLTSTGGLRLRRLHDDATVVVGATQTAQPLVRGSVAAFRLVETDALTAALVAMVPDQDGLAGLVSRLEIEQASRKLVRRPYMRWRGSAVILSHVLGRHRRRVLAERPRLSPQVSLAESGLSADQWKRLGRAFELVEAALGARPGHVGTVDIELADGRVLDIDQHGPSMVICLFESADDRHRWMRRAAAVDFLRAWRAHPDELFGEDIDRLATTGLDPAVDGAVVAVHIDYRRFEDVNQADIDRLVAACRWGAVHISTGQDQAA